MVRCLEDDSWDGAVRFDWIGYTCPAEKCGIEFAVTEGYARHRQNDLKTFHCPNGHPLKWRDAKAYEPEQKPEPPKPKQDESLFGKIFGTRYDKL